MLGEPAAASTARSDADRTTCLLSAGRATRSPSAVGPIAAKEAGVWFAVRYQYALDGVSYRMLRDPGVGESPADRLQLVRRELDVLRTSSPDSVRLQGIDA